MDRGNAETSVSSYSADLDSSFIPSCTDELMKMLKEIQEQTGLPVQSHLSENYGEIAWVQELCPDSAFYGDAYDQFGLFGKDVKTVMAHCVHSDEREIARRKKTVYLLHIVRSRISIFLPALAPIRTSFGARSSCRFQEVMSQEDQQRICFWQWHMRFRHLRCVGD